MQERKNMEAIENLQMQAMVSKASELARAGKYTEAESLLTQLDLPQKDQPHVLDLLARMHAQQGDFISAIDYWDRALKHKPNHVEYIAGISRINEVQRDKSYRGISAAIILKSFAYLIITFLTLTIAKQMYEVNDLIVSHVSPQENPIGKVPQVSTRNLSIDDFRDNGIAVLKYKNDLILRFEAGIFLKGIELTKHAKGLLNSLSKKLEAQQSDIDITVIGFTDNRPVMKGTGFDDNESLGLARALQVVNFMRSISDLNSSLFTIRSNGAKDSPYINNTTSQQFKNRTVELIISSAHTYVGK